MSKYERKPVVQDLHRCSSCGVKHDPDELCPACGWDKANDFLLMEALETDEEGLSLRAEEHFNRINRANY